MSIRRTISRFITFADTMSASLNAPSGISFDATGSLFIADRLNFRVRKVSPDGLISTFAGNGSSWQAEDNGIALEVALESPIGSVMDAQGALYFGELPGSRVRKVTPDGRISTVAGNGEWGTSGDGGPATQAELYWPEGLALDSQGRLYISDGSGNGMYGCSLAGGEATDAMIEAPEGLVVRADGALMFSDPYNAREGG